MKLFDFNNNSYFTSENQTAFLHLLQCRILCIIQCHPQCSPSIDTHPHFVLICFQILIRNLSCLKKWIRHFVHLSILILGLRGNYFFRNKKKMEALLETKILDTQFYFVKKMYPCFIKLSKLNKKNIEMDYVVGFDF